MKTRLALLITAVLLAVGLPIPTHADTPFKFAVNDGNATITGYTGTVPTELDIPAAVTNDDGTYPVTAIGSNAFANKSLTTVILPDTVTIIGNSAFNTSLLTDVTLSDALTTIGHYAFYNNRLADLTLPDTLTTIGDRAFTFNRLTALTLPDTLTTVGAYAFLGNPLASVRLTGAAPEFGTDAFGDNNPSVRFPWRFGTSRTAGGYTTPTWNNYDTIAVADVTFVGGGDVDTQSVDVDDTTVATKPADPVKAGYAFTGWFADDATTPFDFTTPITEDITLTAVFEAEVAPTLEGSELIAAKLGADVSWTPTTLAGYPAPTVTATGLPDGLEIDSETGVISGKVTDALLARGHTVTITASNGIDPDATFDLTISIEYVEYFVRDGNATISGYHGAMPAELDIPDEVTDRNGTYPVTAIGGMAFYDKQLTGLTLPNTLTTIGDFAFADNQLTELTLPGALATIGSYAFRNNHVTKLALLDTSVTTIDDFAFYNNQLTELTLPSTLTTVGDYAFAHNQLTELTLPGALNTMGDRAFHENQLTELGVPASVTSIGQETFMGNPGLDDVRFAGAAPSLGDDALGTHDPAVRFPWQFGDPRVAGGYTAPAWKGYSTIAVADVTVADGDDVATQLIDIGDTAAKPTDPTKAGYVFMGWFVDGATAPFDFATAITGDITLTAVFEAEAAPALEGPELVTATLGTDVSWTPTTLTGTPAPTVTATGLPDGLEIDSETGVISGAVTDAALTGNYDVMVTAANGIDPDVTFELTISIEYFAYSIADGEATITGYHGAVPADLVIPDEIADNSVTYPVTTIGDRAFELNQLTELDLPEALTTIGDYAFQGNRLTELDLPDTLTTIGIWAFHDNRLPELDLPDTLTTISAHAFQGNRLTDLDLPEALTTIGDYAFYDNQLTELTLPDTVATIGGAAFQHNRLTELDLPDTLTTISAHAFYDNQLADLDLPDTVTTIEYRAFFNNQLAELRLPSALTTIGEAAFLSNQLTELSVPASVTSIDGWAFASNPELDDVRFVGAAPGLGDDALGTSDPTVRFRWKLGHPRVTDGFTTPTWHGYDTIAVADVSFVGGSDIEPQTVDVDGTSTAVKPADPARAGYVFADWFTHGATAPFDFTKPITGDTVLTARFADLAVTGLAPSITGNPREGKTLTAKPGPVGPAGAAVAYRWLADGQVIKGTTKPSLKLGKAHAGKRITVTITATRATAPAVTKTSAKTKIVSSTKRRIVVSTRKVGKNQPVTVTATGFKPRQKITIWLGKNKRYTGRADSRGIITRSVKFAKGTKAGTHRIQVQATSQANRTVQTKVRYR